jgi:catechol 2,3-dioxygenase-like lactoylglutathione lyase family enzyme
MRIKRLQHVSLAVDASRAADARHFYGECLGLSEKPRPLGLKHQTLIWYDIGEGEDEVHLILTDPARFERLRIGDHFCLEVDDLDAMRARLEAHAIATIAATPIDGRPRFFVRDPFDNSIEFTQVTGAYTPVGVD